MIAPVKKLIKLPQNTELIGCPDIKAASPVQKMIKDSTIGTQKLSEFLLFLRKTMEKA
jgi:hypothetical protein